MKRGEEKQKQIPMCESYDKISLTDRTTAIQIKFNAKQRKGDILRLALILWDKFIQFDMHRVWWPSEKEFKPEIVACELLD